MRNAKTRIIAVFFLCNNKTAFFGRYFTDFQNKFDENNYECLDLLSQTIDLDEIVPVSFVSHFHAVTDRPPKHLRYPELNLRSYPGTARGTEEWDNTNKILGNIDKSIHHLKDSFCADLLLAGIPQLVMVMVADMIHQHQYIRGLKALIA